MVLSACFSACHLETDAARITNLTYRCSTMSAGKPLLGVKRSRSRATKDCRLGSLHSCECWLLLTVSIFSNCFAKYKTSNYLNSLQTTCCLTPTILPCCQGHSHFGLSIITSPTVGVGRLCFRQRLYVGMYVCEQLPGANSNPTVTKLRQSYPWPQRTRWLNFGRSRSKVKVSGGGMRSTEPF